MVEDNPGTFQRFALICGLVIFLTACASAPATRTATPEPMTDTVTPVYLLPTSTIVNTPIQVTSTATLFQISSTPRALPTNTPLPPPTLEIPPTAAETSAPQPSADSAVIQILSPGSLSKIVSSFGVRGYAVPGYDRKGSLDLYGEDGRLLATQLLQLNTPYKWASFYWELTFHINSVGELGRLSLSTRDEYGRVNAVNSVHLLLLSEGMSIINPPGNLQERCVIDKPVAGQRISGGNLTVSGRMRLFNSLPLTANLVSRDGEVLGTQVVPISSATDDGSVSFRVDIPYRISDSRWALLVISQFDDRISGIMYLYSREIFLNP